MIPRISVQMWVAEKILYVCTFLEVSTCCHVKTNIQKKSSSFGSRIWSQSQVQQHSLPQAKTSGRVCSLSKQWKIKYIEKLELLNKMYLAKPSKPTVVTTKVLKCFFSNGYRLLDQVNALRTAERNLQGFFRLFLKENGSCVCLVSGSSCGIRNPCFHEET